MPRSGSPFRVASLMPTCVIKGRIDGAAHAPYGWTVELLPRLVAGLAIVVLVAVDGCHRSPSQPTKGKDRVQCDHPTRLRIGVFGKYASFRYLVTSALSDDGYPPRLGFLPEDADTVTWGVWWKSTQDQFAASDAGLLSQIPKVVLQLPEYPAVAVRAQDLCSVETTRSSLTATCLDEHGELQQMHYEFPEGCLEFDDSVGVRDLRPVQQSWRNTGSACDAGVEPHKTPVVLDVQIVARPDASSGVLRVRLAAKEYGIERTGFLGGILGTCGVNRIEQPAGITYDCTDEASWVAWAYQVGTKLFFSLGARDQAHFLDSTAAPGLDSVDLPCGAIVEFQAHVPKNMSRDLGGP